MMSNIYCGSDYSPHQYKERCDKETRMKRERKKGVYAAQSVNVGGTTFIVGGMVYDKKGHDPTGIVKRLSAGLHQYWPKDVDLEKKRAFFCAVNVKERGYLAMEFLREKRKFDESIKRTLWRLNLACTI